MIPNEITVSRRENGLSVRFLAQSIINDSVFPQQQGIRMLLSKARNGKKQPLVLSGNEKIYYYFFFHLEDFGSGDKSEIDILLRCGDTLYPVEVKTFTNPNSTNVKREIVRNYLTLHRIAKNGKFSKVTSIIPLLLYSAPFHSFENVSDEEFDYFNEDYIFKMGKDHSEPMTIWNTPTMRLLHPNESQEGFLSKIKHLKSDLYFLTWNDVLETMLQLETFAPLGFLIEELRQKADTKKRRGVEIKIPLVA